MVSRTSSLVKRSEVKVYIASIYEAEMSQSDTVTLDEYTTTEDLKYAAIVNKVSGASISSSVALNVVTMLGAGTNVQVILFVYGKPV
jgi:hypothetical protein